jgi:hypothetical protein
MTRYARRGAWAETALFALASVLLAQMGLGVFLFLVPLQILYTRRGERMLAAGGLLVLAAVAAIRMIGTAVRSGGTGAADGLFVVELAALSLLLLGLLLVDALQNRPLPVLGVRMRAVPRLLGATAAAAAVAIPVVLAVRGQAGIADAVSGVFTSAADAVAAAISQGTRGLQLEGGVDAQGLATRLAQIAAEVFPRSVFVYYFAILTFSWWAGNRSAARASRIPSPRLVDFRLPDLYVWPLIASLALVLADIAFDVGAAGYLGWNAGLIMLFLYGIQGLGLLQFAFARYGVGRGLRFLCYVVLTVLFFSPGANLVVVIGLPGLGVSDIWLRYRTRRRKADADEGDP